MQHNVIDHVVLVLGFVETEGAADVSLVSGRRLAAGGVTHVVVRLQGFSNEGRRNR